jgi:hypothetical protein
MFVRRRIRLPQSTSLAAQLLLIFVSLVALSTIVLTVAAYQSSLTSLEADAKRAVRVAAQTRDETMTQLFTTRRERAEGFLAALESLCGERRADGAGVPHDGTRLRRRPGVSGTHAEPCR